jgi:dipeptidyl aminopeptidase/acylaminoacyl peptidase
MRFVFLTAPNQYNAQQRVSLEPPVEKLLGGPISEKTELARLASPVSHVSVTACPFFIVHGDQDQVVPLRQSIELMMR